MSVPELSVECKDLVREGRLALCPTMSDKERVYAALHARLTASVSDSDGSQVDAAAGVVSLTKPLLGGLAVLLMIGAATLFTRYAPRQSVQPTERESIAAALSIEIYEVPVSAVTSAAATPQEGKALTIVNSRKSLVSPAPDRLAEESALLFRAERDYHAGKLDKALSLTDEHARVFPSGVLRPERVELRRSILSGMSGEHPVAASVSSR